MSSLNDWLKSTDRKRPQGKNHVPVRGAAQRQVAEPVSLGADSFGSDELDATTNAWLATVSAARALLDLGPAPAPPGPPRQQVAAAVPERIRQGLSRMAEPRTSVAKGPISDPAHWSDHHGRKAIAGTHVAAEPVGEGVETREQLLSRLLDPILTLEETAVVLNVCPTTVRRYTNRGSLPHFRTSGNQRRFRLSEVLLFLEQNDPALLPAQSMLNMPSHGIVLDKHIPQQDSEPESSNEKLKVDDRHEFAFAGGSTAQTPRKRNGHSTK